MKNSLCFAFVKSQNFTIPCLVNTYIGQVAKCPTFCREFCFFGTKFEFVCFGLFVCLSVFSSNSFKLFKPFLLQSFCLNFSNLTANLSHDRTFKFFAITIFSHCFCLQFYSSNYRQINLTKHTFPHPTRRQITTKWNLVKNFRIFGGCKNWISLKIDPRFAFGPDPNSHSNDPTARGRFLSSRLT